MGQDSNSMNTPKGLSVGDHVPMIEAVNQNGDLFSLSTALYNGPVVIIFYRGEWCPYCNKHLSDLQEGLESIYQRGASVVAISPEKMEYQNKTLQKTHAEFTLLYDEGYTIAESFDVNFNPSVMNKVVYNLFLGANLKNAHSEESQNLPIPATYIIDTNGKVAWRHFDPNYKNRSTISEIVKELDAIR